MLVSFVAGIDTNKFGKLLEVFIHLLISDHGECFIELKHDVLVFLLDSLAMVIEFDAQTIRGLDRRDLDMLLLDIASS